MIAALGSWSLDGLAKPIEARAPGIPFRWVRVDTEAPGGVERVCKSSAGPTSIFSNGVITAVTD